ncbi:MAG: ribose 1,5-bisphosphate isomerase [Desulfurococcales archaeon]|nr:ribose 1,5-bisphosphate isomerase [Desulfurococcales archaeon]
MVTCSPFKRVSSLVTQLRNGAILGSTEASLKVLNEIKDASRECTLKEFRKYLQEAVPSFIEGRPTSILMRNLVRKYLEQILRAGKEGGFRSVVEKTPETVDSIVKEVEEVKKAVVEVGSRRLSDGATLMIHSYSSTVIRLVMKAFEEGKKFKVFVTESRPIGEGRITASVLGRAGLDVTLIVDSAVRYVMKRVTDVLFSADAVAANGAVINKVGTSVVALAAKEARVRTYVVAGTYKFGLETVFGELVEGMVLNDASLIMHPEQATELAGKVLVRAPLFDVTPPEYIDAIITEVGVVAPQAIPLVIKEKYGWPPKVARVNDLLKEVVGIE